MPSIYIDKKYTILNNNSYICKCNSKSSTENYGKIFEIALRKLLIQARKNQLSDLIGLLYFKPRHAVKIWRNAMTFIAMASLKLKTHCKNKSPVDAGLRLGYIIRVADQWQGHHYCPCLHCKGTKVVAL